MTALFVVCAIMIIGGYKIKYSGENKLLNVAVASDDNAKVTDMLLSMAESIEGINSICRFEQMNIDEAMNAANQREVDLVIEIPANFYEKASSMQETSFNIYVCDEGPASQKKFLAIIEGVQEMMLVTEGAISSVYEGMEVYSFPMSRQQMEVDLFADVIERYMNRMDNFEIDYVSAYGSYSFAEYYIVSALMCITILCSMTFMGIYSHGDTQLERMIAVSAGKRIIVSVGKIISMTIPVGLFFSLIAFIAGRNGALNFTPGAGTYMSLWMLAFSEAIYVHFIVSVVGYNANTRTIYWLVMLILLVCAGVLVPRVYLPNGLRNLFAYIPQVKWQGMLLRGIWDSGRRNMTLEYLGYVLISDALLGAVAVFLYGRRLKGHD